MHDIAYEFLIPYDTPESTPQSVYLPLLAGTLKKVWIGFPSGCARMVHIQIRHNERIVLPVNLESSYAYNNVVLERECKIHLTDEPYEIEIVGWSDGTAYDHTISFVFAIQTPDEMGNDFLKMLIG